MDIETTLVTTLEIAIKWENGFNRDELAQRSGVSRRTAQRFMNQYREKYPNYVVYCAKTKRYQRGNAFTPRLISEDPEDYLQYCRGKVMENALIQEENMGGINVESIDNLVSPEVDDQTTSTLINALNSKLQVSCIYESKNGSRKHIVLSPHAIVFARRRYHIRAYHHRVERYSDFVLGRFYGVEILPGNNAVSSHEDHEWHTNVTLTFKLNPDLSEEAKHSARLEWNMSRRGEVITRTVRTALVKYVKAELETPSISTAPLPTWILQED